MVARHTDAQGRLRVSEVLILALEDELVTGNRSNTINNMAATVRPLLPDLSYSSLYSSLSLFL